MNLRAGTPHPAVDIAPTLKADSTASATSVATPVRASGVREPQIFRDARLAWSLVPLDCKSSLVKLKATGRMGEARAEILSEAEKGLKLLGDYSVLDVTASLELAAEHWLEAHPL